jgi:tRNA(Ile)-lysidine synthase
MVIVPDTPACRAAAADGCLRLRAMGEDLARRLGEVAPAAAASLRARVAPRAIASLPVLTRLDVPLAFPHLTESIRREAAEDETLAHSTFRAWFAPSRPLDGDGVFWAMAGEHSAGKRPRS